MANTDELKRTIISLPLAEREALLKTLGASVAEDHRQRARAEESAHLAVVADRRHQRDRGEMHTVPVDDVMPHIFGKQ